MERIETNRFYLRKVIKEDAEEIFKILSDESVIQNLNQDIHKTVKDTETMLDEYFEEYEKGNKYPFAIIDKETGNFIGVFLIKLDLYDEDCFEFTVYIKKEEWGKGIYTEVLPFMTTFAFDEIKTGNFRGFVMEKNIASARVLEKCGFKLEKIFDVPGLEGKILSFLMTKEDYLKNKERKG